eukprot:XP_011668529.1 PREDICTED: uncharacterized protein LOC100890194 [Strongylocentrotus purpuratus]
MHSRAYLLLDREYYMLQRDPVWGINAHPLSEDNMMEWTATIRGLKGTIWEGGIFVLSLKFDENFNYRPPDVRFHTIPFHPNIDMQTGCPCVEFLDDVNYWKETYSLQSILLAIQEKSKQSTSILRVCCTVIFVANSLLEAISNDPKLQTAHFSLDMEELQNHMKQQLETHNSLMYGKFGPKQSNKEPDGKDKRLDHINKMRKIYLPKRTVPPPSTAPSETEDAWEKEVDDLVAWSNDLSEDHLK